MTEPGSLSEFQKNSLLGMDPRGLYRKDALNYWKAVGDSTDKCAKSTHLMHRLAALGLLRKLDGETMEMTNAGREARRKLEYAP